MQNLTKYSVRLQISVTKTQTPIPGLKFTRFCALQDQTLLIFDFESMICAEYLADSEWLCDRLN